MEDAEKVFFFLVFFYIHHIATTPGRKRASGENHVRSTYIFRAVLNGARASILVACHNV